MAKLAVHNIDGKETGSIELPREIFDVRVNTDVIHQAVVMYRAASRQGTASTKERAEVHGGGKKPYRQKGTGQARAGSTRSPLWKGGGVTFGPKPKDFSYAIPKRIKKAALKASLNDKYKGNALFCVDEFKKEFSKTKEFAVVLAKLKLQGKVLALLDEAHQGVYRASKNIPQIQLMRSADVNAFDVVKHKNILLTKSAVDNLLKRLK